MPMTVDEFAGKIKDKYPGYSDVPNDVLVQKILVKYPGYKGQVTFEQTTPEAQKQPSSAGSLLKGIAKAPADIFIGRAKGVGNTLLGMGQLGQKGLAKLTGIQPVGGQESFNSSLDAVRSKLEGSNTVQKIAKGAEQIGEFFVPVGGQAKGLQVGGNLLKSMPNLGKVANIVGRGLSEGVEQMVRSSAQRGTTEGSKNDFLLGAATSPTLKAVGLAAKGAGSVTKGIVSKVSGVPAEAINLALKSPAKVKKAMRDFAASGDIAPEQILAHAEDAFNSVKSMRDDAYRAAIEKVQNAKNFKLGDPGEVKNAFIAPLKKFGFDIGENGSVVFGKKVTLPKNKQSEIDEVVSRMNEWDDFSPLGINDLRKVVSSYKKNGVLASTADKQFNSILGKIENGLSDYASELSPKIKELNKAYAKDSELLDHAMSALSLGKGKPDTAARKLLNVLNPKSDVYRKVLQDLGERAGKDLESQIAGYSMSKFIPEGLTSRVGAGVATGLGALTNPAFIAGAAASSPRLVGETATALGSALGSRAGRAISQYGEKALTNLIKGASSQLNR